MREPKDTGEFEIVRVNSGKKIQRYKAYEQGEILPLVCATLPLIGTDEIAELLRSGKKRLLGNEWVFFMSEHKKAEDRTTLETLTRGLKEELNYTMENGFFDLDEEIILKYRDRACQKALRWKVHSYVVPINSLSDLTPDGKEIIEIRSRPIDEVMHDLYKKKSIYKKFSPELFFKTIDMRTRQVIADNKINY